MDSIPPQDALAELMRLLEELRGEAILRYERPGSEHRWRITSEGPEPAEPAVEREPGEMERNLLGAALRLPDQDQTGQQLAQVAGYVYNPRVRSALSRLRQRGLLTGRAGDTGYRPTARALREAKGET